MRVAIVTESFLPNVNGVTNSVLRLLENLAESGDQALVIAPAAEGIPSSYAGHPRSNHCGNSYPKFPTGKYANGATTKAN